jgi:hypothetical protein
MSDLIDREEALTALRDTLKSGGKSKGLRPVTFEMIWAIKSLPSAEPKKGKWIKENIVLTSNPPQYVWHCSECGNPERGFSIHILTNHCPACGAKMEVTE